MLMNPKKGETAVHGGHCPGDMAVHMREVLARPWVGVCVPLQLFFIFFLSISNLGELETVMKAISKCHALKILKQTPMWLSYDGRYNNQGLQTKQLCNST